MVLLARSIIRFGSKHFIDSFNIQENFIIPDGGKFVWSGQHRDARCTVKYKTNSKIEGIDREKT